MPTDADSVAVVHDGGLPGEGDAESGGSGGTRPDNGPMLRVVIALGVGVVLMVVLFLTRSGSEEPAAGGPPAAPRATIGDSPPEVEVRMEEGAVVINGRRIPQQKLLDTAAYEADREAAVRAKDPCGLLVLPKIDLRDLAGVGESYAALLRGVDRATGWIPAEIAEDVGKLRSALAGVPGLLEQGKLDQVYSIGRSAQVAGPFERVNAWYEAAC